MASLEEVVEYAVKEMMNDGAIFITNKQTRDWDWNGEKSFTVGKKVFKNVVPGFFTPFQSGRDFGVNLGLTLAAPILAPLLIGTLTAIFAIGAAVAALTMVGSLMFAAGAFPFDSEIADVAGIIGLYAGAASFGFIVGTLLVPLISMVGLLAFPLGLVHFTTRSVASIPTLLGDAPVDEENSMMLAF